MIRSLALCLLAVSLVFSVPAKNVGFSEDTQLSETDWEEMMKQYRYEEYEALYFAVIEQCGEPGTPDFLTHPKSVQSLFVAMMFDMEIQNGGVAQFFWNDGSVYAKLVPDALHEIGMDDVAALYEQFVQEKNITLEEIDTYRERFPMMEEDFYAYHPFDEFDEAYMNIWKETNINARFLDYAAKHPEINEAE
ncbi:MAG: DUF4375 domain-containing protein [Clostridia bacterium]|nr:DUF4375 domain-containing protein [Clostridia bacterium]